MDLPPQCDSREPKGIGFDDLSVFPGWTAFPGLLLSRIEQIGAKKVLDIGGGANPMLSATLGALECDVLDIDPTELEKASGTYSRKIVVDACTDPESLRRVTGRGGYDLIFSHMFLEHISNPDAFHRNMFELLVPGGRVLHAFPIPRSLPLLVNYVLPESLSTKLLSLFHPKRDLAGNERKFPALYQRCSPPNPKSIGYFEAFGFRVCTYVGFVGHEYYRNIPVLRSVERALRPIVRGLKLPLASYGLLELERPLV